MTLIPSQPTTPLIAGGGRNSPTGGFGRAELDAIARRCPEQIMGAGECIFREGAPLAHIYIVREGMVGLGRRSRGRRATFLLLRPNDVVGDVAALLGGVALFDAFAVTDARLVVVPAAGFLEALDLRTSFSRQWAIGLGGRFSALQARLEELLGGDLRSQVAALLHHQLNGTSRVVSLTQQTIADLLGVPRTSVTRTLRGLQRQGIIEIGYGHIAIRDHAALAAAAGAAHRATA